MCDEGAYNLIEAIIEQAKRDYRKALKKPNKSEYQSIDALEVFFHSDWFHFLTNGKMSGREAIELARRGTYA